MAACADQTIAAGMAQRLPSVARSRGTTIPFDESFVTTDARTVLVVSPHFPPSSLAGVHRARHLAKHLPAHRWHPVILRVDECHYSEASDPVLASLVPPSVEQIRTGALSAQSMRLFGVGDIGIRAYWAIGSAIEAAVAQYAPRAILITGSPYYPMLLTPWIRRRFDVPVVLDFQDPWVSAQGATRPYFSKGRMAHRLSLALEPRAVRAASWITSVSETQNDEMADRYRWLDRAMMTAIPIGGDPDDFAALRAAASAGDDVSLEEGTVNLCYVGTFLPRAGSVVRALFKAVSKLRSESPDLAARLRLVFVGTSNQPLGSGYQRAPGSHLVSLIAAEEGIGDLVKEHPPRVGYVHALSLISKAHGLLLLGSDEPHYTASKIYPALMSGRPYISIFHEKSSAHEILLRSGGGITIAFATVPDLEAQVPRIAEALWHLATDPEKLGCADPSAYAETTASAVAGRFARVFDEIANRPSRHK